MLLKPVLQQRRCTVYTPQIISAKASIEICRCFDLAVHLYLPLLHRAFLLKAPRISRIAIRECELRLRISSRSLPVLHLESLIVSNKVLRLLFFKVLSAPERSSCLILQNVIRSTTELSYFSSGHRSEKSDSEYLLTLKLLQAPRGRRSPLLTLCLFASESSPSARLLDSVTFFLSFDGGVHPSR